MLVNAGGNLRVEHRHGEFWIVIEPESTINIVKAKIQTQEGIPLDQQCLTTKWKHCFGNPEFKDHGMLLDIGVGQPGFWDPLWLHNLGDVADDEGGG